MKTSRYSDSQILAILKQAEAGTPVPAMPGTRHEQRDILQVACQVRRDGCLTDEAHEGAGGRESAPEEDVCR